MKFQDMAVTGSGFSKKNNFTDGDHNTKKTEFKKCDGELRMARTDPSRGGGMICIRRNTGTSEKKTNLQK